MKVRYFPLGNLAQDGQKQMRYFAARIFVIIPLVVFFAHLPCFADGYITVVKSIGKLPDIPTQRGIVQFRDGLETLVVETSFEAEGYRFGWVIPVPSIPMKFQRLSSGLFDALSIQIQPEIVRLNSALVVNLIMLAALFSLIIFRFGLKALRFKNYDLGLRLLIAFPFFYIVGLIAAGLFGEYRGGPSSSVLGVQVMGRQTVGNYDISVLEATDSTRFNQWLAENGFVTLSPNAKGIVESYIADKWFFVTAKFTETGKNRKRKTHPVLIQFQAERPVYPLRLTSIAGSNLGLEVYVIADQEAVPVDYALKKEFCAQIELPVKPTDWNYPWNEAAPIKFFYPEAHEVMWEGCALSKFSGIIFSKDMKRDLQFSLEDFGNSLKTFRRTYWDYRAGIIVASFCTLIVALAIIFLLNMEWGKRRMAGSSARYLLWIALPAVFSISYFILGDKIDMESVKKIHCIDSIAEADVKNAYLAAHEYFLTNPSGFPSLEDLKDMGFLKSGECVEFRIGGKSKKDFSITGFLLNGTGSIYKIDASGKVSANNKERGIMKPPIHLGQ